jgi:hypothetical protein
MAGHRLEHQTGSGTANWLEHKTVKSSFCRKSRMSLTDEEKLAVAVRGLEKGDLSGPFYFSAAQMNATIGTMTRKVHSRMRFFV